MISRRRGDRRMPDVANRTVPNTETFSRDVDVLAGKLADSHGAEREALRRKLTEAVNRDVDQVLNSFMNRYIHTI